MPAARVANLSAILGHGVVLHPTQADGDGPETDQRPWTTDELHELVGDESMPEKQVVVLRALADGAPNRVFASDLRELLVEQSLVTSNYPGKALGGIILTLERRARWYHDAPLFERDWDDHRWETWYKLIPEYTEDLRAAIARRLEIE